MAKQKPMLVLYEAGVKALACLGDLVRDNVASDEEKEAYEELKGALNDYEQGRLKG